jgi:hypothetical protein
MIAMLKATPLILGLLIFIATLSTFFGSKSLSQPARATIELPVLLEYCSELPNVVCLTGDDEPWKSSHFLLGPPNDRYKGQNKFTVL